MGKPCDFEQSNTLLKGDHLETNGQKVANMPVQVDPFTHKTVSCWKLSDEELKTIMESGKVYLMVFGNAHPPVWVGAYPYTDGKSGN